MGKATEIGIKLNVDNGVGQTLEVQRWRILDINIKSKFRGKRINNEVAGKLNKVIGDFCRGNIELSNFGGPVIRGGNHGAKGIGVGQ